MTKSGNSSRPLCYATSGRNIGSDGHGQTFHALDLKKGYYQVLVEPEYQTKTTFITEFGKYQFRVMPFRLSNAPTTFQRLMDFMLKDTTNIAKCYIDYIAKHGQNTSITSEKFSQGYREQDSPYYSLSASWELNPVNFSVIM